MAAEDCWRRAQQPATGAVVLRLPCGHAEHGVERHWQTLAARDGVLPEWLSLTPTDPVGELVRLLSGERPASGDWTGACRMLATVTDVEVAILTRAPDLEPEGRRELATFLNHWADYARRRRADEEILGNYSITLLTILGLPVGEPRLDAGLCVVPSFRFPAPLTQQPEYVLETGAATGRDLWQAAVFPELAAFDAGLEAYLHTRGVVDALGLRAVLREFACSRGWDRLAPDVSAAVQRFPCPGTDWRSGPNDVGTGCDLELLWEAGLAGPVDGRGWELHAAVLALSRPSSELGHRIWRGLARLCWPLLGVARARVEVQARQQIGNEAFSDALLSIKLADNSADGPQAWADDQAELGDLAVVLGACHGHSLPASLAWHCRACQRRVRNALAHEQSPQASDLDYLLQLLRLTERD